MASKKLGKDSVEWQIFADTWKMLQEFYIPEGSDEYWGALVNRAREMEHKYEGNGLAIKQALAIIDTLDAAWRDEWKKRQEGTAR